MQEMDALGYLTQLPADRRANLVSQLPLASFSQQRLWFLDQFAPSNAAYHVYKALRFAGPLNQTALEASIGEIVQRHQILRTVLVALEEELYQVLLPYRPRSLPLTDFQSVPEAARETELWRCISEEISRPFNLARGPLLRVRLLRLTEEEHVLLVVMHHIICDGWSMEILLRELAALYRAHIMEIPAALPILPIQYSDYVMWQRERMRDKALQGQISYWRQRLEGMPSVLQLPTDRARPIIQTFQGATQVIHFSQQLTIMLHSLSRREGVTLFMTLLAAFQTLLYRYTNQEDIVIGSPVAGRNRRETEGVIGFFTNTQILRTNLSGNPPFRTLLQRVREVVLGAQENQDVPLEKLVEIAKPSRNPSYNPLFQVMFSLQNDVMSCPEFPGLRSSSIDIDSRTAKFDLSLSITQGANELTVAMEYNTDLFDAETIMRMLEHLRMLLQGVVANPDQQLAETNLLTAIERWKMLTVWNDTGVSYSRDNCIHELFEDQVDKNPDAVAVVFETDYLTYDQLNRRANQVARYLRKRGVGPDVLVGVFMERSLEMLIGLLGILKAGGAYVPLDPTYPTARLALMLDDMQGSVVLTQARLLGDLPKYRGQIVCLDRDQPAIGREADSNLGYIVHPDNLVYVIYTSGSTGIPKGVMNTHKAIYNRLSWMQDTYQLTAADSVLQKTPISFDVSVWELFWPLLAGSRLIVARPDGHRDGAYLANLIAEQQITILHFVPSMLQVFLEEQLLDRCRSLKYVICSGEALSTELLERFYCHLDAELHNLYGPTETAIDVTFWKCEPNDQKQIVPIGRPIANMEIYLLDACLEPVPIGMLGEIHIGGVGLARGYLMRPDLTAEHFIPHPFTAELGARLYRTGDLGRFLPDGNIEFVGRSDQQTKIRGVRIEMGEIEATLVRHPTVRESVVLAHEDAIGDKHLVAYVVPRGGVAPTSSELRGALKEVLPEYMVPFTFVTLAELPLMPNGKVNRGALPAPDEFQSDQHVGYIAPRDPVETHLAGIWEELLDIGQIGIRNDFFNLGGNSLLAIRLMSRIEKLFGQDLPVSALFMDPTIEGLAKTIRARTHRTQHSSVIEIQPKGSERPLFCIANGNVLCYAELARYMYPEYPLLVLQFPEFSEETIPTSVEETARRYVRDLRVVQREGPYTLIGYCSGGFIAAEMARQLLECREEIALLALIDTVLPSADWSPDYHTDDNAWVLASFAYALIEDPLLGVKIEDLRGLQPDAQLRYVLDRAKSAEVLPEETSLSQIRRLVENHRATLKILPMYKQEVLSTKITICASTEALEAYSLDATLGWGRLVDQAIDVLIIPGKHHAILRRPSVEILANRLKRCLVADATISRSHPERLHE